MKSRDHKLIWDDVVPPSDVLTPLARQLHDPVLSDLQAVMRLCCRRAAPTLLMFEIKCQLLQLFSRTLCHCELQNCSVHLVLFTAASCSVASEVKGHSSPVCVSVWRPGPLRAGGGGRSVRRPSPPPPPPPPPRRGRPLSAGRAPGGRRCRRCRSIPSTPVPPVHPHQQQHGGHSRGRRQEGQRRHLWVWRVHWRCSSYVWIVSCL